ncbi:MAG: DNA methyltransferase [Candidatus Altiarchaeota archaeon]
MKKDIFELSITKELPYSELLVKKPEYRQLVTFKENKKKPIYNWFYYKEGFSPELVINLLEKLEIKKGSDILDPFCGTGNTLLACKENGYNAIGFDILPLSVFVSNTKLQRDYDTEKLRNAIKNITQIKFGEPKIKWPKLWFLSIDAVFSRYAREDLLFFKEKILQVKDEKIRNFLFLGLLSIVGEASNTKKDGGVIRIVKKKHLAPVRYLLKNRLKRMYKDIKRLNPKENELKVEAKVGDAKFLDITEKFDACITSPPYLNFVDYTKLYGLELALFLNDNKEVEDVRKNAIRSFICADTELKGKVNSEVLYKSLSKIKEKPKIVECYFYDMQLAMCSIFNALKKKGKAAIVIGNTCLPEITIDCDLILAEISEKIGFKVKEIWVANARWCTVNGIKKEKPVRESILILEK